MGFQRHFLGFELPAVQASAEYLITRYQGRNLTDLSRALVVVPVSRAARQLRKQLAVTARKRGTPLLAPQIVTVSLVPELLYPAQRRLASPWIQQLAWATALRHADPITRRRLVPMVPDELDVSTAGGTTEWLELGRLFWNQYRELTAEGLSFADVGEFGSRMEDFPDEQRWQAMGVLQESYLRLLDKLDLWDPQTARLVAIRKHECHTEKDLLLLGTSDLNRTLRDMLGQIADRVTLLIHAPPDWDGRFDEYGCLRTESWQNAPIELADNDWSIAEGPDDQAQCVASLITRFDGKYGAGEITVGCADSALVPYVQRALRSRNVGARFGPGRSVSQSGPFLLLDALGRWLETHDVNALASLARHPDLVSWLRNRNIGDEAIAELDRARTDQLPARLGTGRFSQIGVCSALDQLRAYVNGPDRILSEWALPIGQLLSNIYGKQVLDPDDEANRMTLRGCEMLVEALEEVERSPAELTGKVSAADAIRVVLGSISHGLIPRPDDDQTVELLGWLELPLDEAPALVVTGLNEGVVPKSITSDLFLPDRLRQHLQIDDNMRRYARDAYALSVLLGSREGIHVVVGRRDAIGDPLRPSRLLFATDESQMAKRWLRILNSSGPSLATTELISAAASSFQVPRPQPLREPIAALRVTDFGRYLACPYRFYLERVLSLKRVDDLAREMEASVFGSLAHKVLENFGNSAVSDSTKSATIREFLNDTLSKLANERFGVFPLPAVPVQLEQMRLRLDAFADRQAIRAREGWRIERVEWKVPSAECELAGKRVRLSGHIDRIDRHEETKKLQILDYKTSDIARDPDKAHRAADQTWTDLQLPLYRHLATSGGLDNPLSIELAYFSLPRNVEQTKVAIAPWTDDELESADRVAGEVAVAIENERFWPPKDPPPRYSQLWDYICMVGLLEKPNLEQPQVNRTSQPPSRERQMTFW